MDSSKIKILFVASYPNQPIGYSKVANKITNYLAEKGADVYYFGFSNFPQSKIDRYIHPSIKLIDVVEEEKQLGTTELYGVNIIEREMRRIKPDILFIYNDIIVTCRLMNALINYRDEFKDTYKTYVYLDLVYDFEKPVLINHININCDKIFVFTDYWKNNLIEMNIPEDKIEVFYHGVDRIPSYDKAKARKELSIDDNDFVVLNTNRNSYRKAWDITISAFIIFLKRNYMNPHIKLFINCDTNIKTGYDILSLIRTECLRLNVDYERVCSKHIMTSNINSGILEDKDLYNIYNVADVGINTCVGEGFGLCNTEHATVGAPQIVSKVGGLKDIFNGLCICVEPVARLNATNLLDEHNGYMYICRAEDFADALDIYYKNVNRRLNDGNAIKYHILTKYKWDVILDNMVKHLLPVKEEKALVAVSGIGHLDSTQHLINKRTYAV